VGRKMAQETLEKFLTKQEFEEWYARNSNMNINELHELGLHAYPCVCGEKGCKGWQMFTDNGMGQLRQLGHIPNKETL